MFHYHAGRYEYDQDRQRQALAWCAETCADSLARGMDVVVANTFTRIAFIDQYRRIADRYGADFRVIRMTSQFGNIHDVPAERLASMRDGFEDYEGEMLISASEM